MTKGQEMTYKMVRANNLAMVAAVEIAGTMSGAKWLHTWFCHNDGIYYDPVGDEIFECRRVGGTDHMPEYAINFGDEVKVGGIKDHGLHEQLDILRPSDWKILDLRNKGFGK